MRECVCHLTTEMNRGNSVENSSWSRNLSLVIFPDAQVKRRDYGLVGDRQLHSLTSLFSPPGKRLRMAGYAGGATLVRFVSKHPRTSRSSLFPVGRLPK